MKNLLTILLIPSILSANPIKNAFNKQLINIAKNNIRTSQLVRFSSTLNKDIASIKVENQEYKCEKCLTTSDCQIFKKAMDIAKKLPREKLNKDDRTDVFGFSALSILFATPSAYLLSDILSRGMSEDIILPVILAIPSALFGFEAISRVVHVNDGWRAANKLNDAISKNGSKSKKRTTIIPMPYPQAPLLLPQSITKSQTEKEQDEQNLINTCCEAQKKLQQIEKELGK